MKKFNSIDEITYDDYRHYHLLSLIDSNVSTNRRLGPLCAFYGLASIGLLVGAILISGGAAIGLGIGSAMLFGAFGLTTMALVAPFSKDSKEITKEEYKKAVAEWKELKKAKEWEAYTDIMLKYYYSPKYFDDKAKYYGHEIDIETPTDNYSLIQKCLEKGKPLEETSTPTKPVKVKPFIHKSISADINFDDNTDGSSID